MQVKRRINQFFDNIRRKDKGNSSDEETPSRVKKKWKKSKNNQNYSQWDLIDNMGADPTQDDEEILNQNQSEIRVQIRSGELESPKNHAWDEKENLVEIGGGDVEDSKKRKSFLKRSGSLLRRSIRRNKKPSGSQTPDPLDNQDPDLTDIVQEINQTLVAVATFGESPKNAIGDGDDTRGEIFENGHGQFQDDDLSPHENFSIEIVEVQLHNNTPPDQDETDIEQVDPKSGKFALRKGLQRQASKLISKFQRSPGSLRLKPSPSIDNFPNNTFPRRRRSASYSGTVAEAIMDSAEGKVKPTKTGSFRRKMSFKKARKAVTKGVISLGKTMVSASSVMPVAYECPHVTYYTDYEAAAPYPSEFEQYYYRTQSYLPKNWDDKQNLQYSRKPASYYQHGYCN